MKLTDIGLRLGFLIGYLTRAAFAPRGALARPIFAPSPQWSRWLRHAQPEGRTMVGGERIELPTNGV
jgi:hypothetical protein